MNTKSLSDQSTKDTNQPSHSLFTDTIQNWIQNSPPKTQTKWYHQRYGQWHCPLPNFEESSPCLPIFDDIPPEISNEDPPFSEQKKSITEETLIGIDDGLSSEGISYAIDLSLLKTAVLGFYFIVNKGFPLLEQYLNSFQCLPILYHLHVKNLLFYTF